MVEVGETFGNIFGSMFSASVWVLIALLGAAIVGGIFYYFFIYRKKFDIFVKIISDRASDARIIFDKAAILVDRKTNTKYFRLLGIKVELEVPPYKVMEHTNKGDYLELWRKSEEEFRFLVKPKIDKEMFIGGDGKTYPFAKTIQKSIEADIDWVVRRKTSNKTLLDPEGLLWKILQYAPQILTTAFLLIIVYVFMQELPTILSQLTQLVKEMQSLKGATITAG